MLAPDAVAADPEPVDPVKPADVPCSHRWLPLTQGSSRPFELHTIRYSSSGSATLEDLELAVQSVGPLLRRRGLIVGRLRIGSRLGCSGISLLSLSLSLSLSL